MPAIKTMIDLVGGYGETAQEESAQRCQPVTGLAWGTDLFDIVGLAFGAGD